MDFHFQQTSNTAKLMIIGLFLVVSYLLYSLTVSVYKSYQIDLHIKSFEAENSRIEAENRKQSEDFDYYSSKSYIEKMAKQNLGLIYPGEQVIIIPNESFDNSESENGTVDTENDQKSSVSNPQKWWKFFFDRSSQNQ